MRIPARLDPPDGVNVEERDIARWIRPSRIIFDFPEGKRVL